MEQNGSDQNLSPANLCRNGCGFYSSPQFDGLCSKCYKDYVKRRQQSSSPNGLLSPQQAMALEARLSEASISDKPTKSAVEPKTVLETPTTTTSPTSAAAAVSIKDTASLQETESLESTSDSEKSKADVSSNDDDGSAEKEKKPKKNRCHTCKKKVGLTGFECRCGGLYCSAHRYSDKHECSFDYKQLAQDEIRKANPVVQAAKMTKI